MKQKALVVELRRRVQVGISSWHTELRHRNRPAYESLQDKDLTALGLTLVAELNTRTKEIISEEEPYRIFAERIARMFADGDRRNLGTGSGSDTYEPTSEDLEALHRLIHEARKLTGAKPDCLLEDNEAVCDCGQIVTAHDPYFATPCGTFYEDCMRQHVKVCGVCAHAFGLEG